MFKLLSHLIDNIIQSACQHYCKINLSNITVYYYFTSSLTWYIVWYIIVFNIIIGINWSWYEFNITTFLLGLLIFLLVQGLRVAVFRSGCILWNTWSLLFVSSATSVQSCTMMAVLSVRGIFRQKQSHDLWSLLGLWKLSNHVTFSSHWPLDPNHITNDESAAAQMSF